SVPHRLDGRIGRPGHSDHHDRDAGVDSPELSQDIQAGLVGQAQVEENNVRASGGDPFQALCARLCDLNPVCGRGEHVAHSVPEQVRVVIDQEQGGHVTRAPAQWYDLKMRWSLYQSVTKRSVLCLNPTISTT